MNRLFANVCSSNLSKAKRFYTELFGFQVKYDSDWFVHLCDPVNSSLELGLIDQNHELVPESARGQSSGIYITLVVDDVDSVYRKAQELKVKIIAPPIPSFMDKRECCFKIQTVAFWISRRFIMPNPSFERDAAEARRPSILRWAFFVPTR